jgi:glycine/D-amino acid oxidase-like deaminating enzyme
MDLTSGYPFWPVKDGLLQAYPPLEEDATCDVLVIGGGATGALIAFRLVEAGIDTIVVEKRDVGFGSTSATTGLILYEIDTTLTELIGLVGEDHAARAYGACVEGVRRFGELVAGLDDRSGFARRESVYLAVRPEDAGLLERECAVRRRHGIDVELLTKQEIAGRFPFERPAALLSRDAAQIDAYRLTHALLRCVVERGARVYDRSEVIGITTDKSTITAQTIRNTHIRARRLVFATGYESAHYLREPVARLISTYALVSEPLTSFEGWSGQPIIWEHADPYLYLRPTEDGRVMIGGEDEDFRDPVRRDRLIARKTRVLQRKFAALFPAIRLDVAFSWAGTFGETKDGLPYVDQTPEWPGAWFALCYGGNGLTFAILAAEIIRDAILGKRHEYADLFRFDR